MTNPTNWPNPERPGVPMFPERDGLHVVLGRFDSTPTLILWRSQTGDWLKGAVSLTPEEMSDARITYYGPHLTPTQIAELLAGERERCAVICDGIEDAEWGKWKKHADMMAQGASNGAMDCASAIRNLGDAS